MESPASPEEPRYGKAQRTRSQIGRGSKTKGNAYERYVCKVANAVLNVPPFNWEWVRTPRSGGWIKASNDPSLRKLRGDITVPDACPLLPEVKKRENWSMDQIHKVGLEAWEPFKWYQEALDKAHHAGKIPLLIFSRNLQPALAMLEGGDLLQVTGGPPMAQAIWVDGYVILRFEDFLKAFAEHQAILIRAYLIDGAQA